MQRPFDFYGFFDRHTLPELSSLTSDLMADVTESAATRRSFFVITALDGRWNAVLMSPSTHSSVSCPGTVVSFDLVELSILLTIPIDVVCCFSETLSLRAKKMENQTLHLRKLFPTLVFSRLRIPFFTHRESYKK